MLNDDIRNKLTEKIRNDGGDENFVCTLSEVIKKEDLGAEKSKREYFRVEKLIIWFSMLSSVAAAISTINVSEWGNRILTGIRPLFDIVSIVLPAVVTALVAYRGLKKSFETWIRHRKNSLELKLLIDAYLYGNEEFDQSSGQEAYKKFRNEVQGLYRKSKDEFLTNMSK